VTFLGERSITLAPGQDVVSDPSGIHFSALQTLAISLYVANGPGKPSEHYTARQTSYLTLPLAGDHTSDTSGGAFTETTTTRPYFDGLDVLAPESAGAVVAFGDSITDGYQAGPAGIPEVASSVDANGRWPDDLARRLIAAHIPLSVLNAGISGNLVLNNASTDAFGPPALQRLDNDVLAQRGVTTVIWLEGINDLPGGTTAAQLEAGWTAGIARMHKAGLRVLQGTLTPSGSATGTVQGYSTAQVNQVREQANAWIRTMSPADDVIDFDAAVRDPNKPSQINPAYNGGDGLHFNLAGYQAMANAINLALLRRPICAAGALRLTVTPMTITAGVRTVLHVTASTRLGARVYPVARALITVGDRRLRTNRQGRAAIAVRALRAGRLGVELTAGGYRTVRLTLRIATPRHERRPLM
jgi:lysophospholipase L1-like esterase